MGLTYVPPLLSRTFSFSKKNNDGEPLTKLTDHFNNNTHVVKVNDETESTVSSLLEDEDYFTLSDISEKRSKKSSKKSKKDKKSSSREDINSVVAENNSNMLADYIIQASGGCILYADRVLNLFRTAKLQVKLPSSFNMVNA